MLHWARFLIQPAIWRDRLPAPLWRHLCQVLPLWSPRQCVPQDSASECCLPFSHNIFHNCPVPRCNSPETGGDCLRSNTVLYRYFQSWGFAGWPPSIWRHPRRALRCRRPPWLRPQALQYFHLWQACHFAEARLPVGLPARQRLSCFPQSPRPSPDRDHHCILSLRLLPEPASPWFDLQSLHTSPHQRFPGWSPPPASSEDLPLKRN